MIELDINQWVNQIWETYDTNEDGFLDRDEVKVFLMTGAASIMPIVFDQREFDREFDALDTEKKNCLNHDQFTTFVMNYASLWSERKKNSLEKYWRAPKLQL